MSKILEAAYGSPDRPLVIGNFEIPCYVLNDEKRVITQSGFLKALGISYRGLTEKELKKGEETPARLVRFISGQRISPFISSELKSLLQHPIKFKALTNVAYGYEATCLVDVCDAIMQAHKVGALQKQQAHIADRAETLIRAFAKTGIIALVDEATGYQEKRDKSALQEFLSKFIKEQRGIYIKTYPDEFFEAIFKMRNLNWSLANKGRKPQYIGHYINNYVYSRIAPNVLGELRRVNPKDDITGKRKGKHPQYIDIDFGHPKLKEHLNVLVMFAKAAGYNWGNWERLVNRALPKFESDGSQIQQLDFNDV